MKDWFRERFHGLYWRQMAVTVGMVFLTLVLLGVSFFSLSYSYARGQKTDELMVRAMAVSKLSVRYLETGRYLSMEELQKDEQFRQLAATAAVISEMDILVCDMDGHVLLSTDAAMEGRSVTIPSSVMDKVSADGTWAGRSRLDQIYASKQFVGGVSVVNPTTGEVLGAVFTVCASDSVDNLWRAFAGLLMMTGFVVLMISFMASSITTMRQIQPIREIAGIVKPYPGCRLHADATQAVGKTDLWLDGVDTMSFTAHKFYGPNGIGALYKRRGLVIEPQISGGASTTIYRSGTPTLGLAVSLDAALTKALAGQNARNAHVQRLHDRLLAEGLKSRLILTVHDELLVETAAEEEQEVRKILAEEMHGAAQLSVMLEIDVHAGSDWYQAK